MLNRSAKGQRKERMCKQELIAEGYRYTWSTIRHKFLKIDLFGEFDVVAANATHVRLIQVKSGYCENKVRERIRAMRLPPFCIKEIWCYHDREVVRKEVIE